MRNKQSGVFFVLPLFVAATFAGLMFYFAIISSEKAREHFKAKKLNEAVTTLAKISVGQNNPAIKLNQKLTPTPLPTPEPTKSLLETAKYYEMDKLIIVFFLLCTEFWFLSFLFGKLPKRNPFQLNDLMRRGLLVMICSFIFSPALLILYIWMLRVGLI